MSKRHAGGRCCAAGKVKPKYPDNPLLSEYYAAKKLEKARTKKNWKLAGASVLDRFLLIGKPKKH